MKSIAHIILTTLAVICAPMALISAAQAANPAASAPAKALKCAARTETAKVVRVKAAPTAVGGVVATVRTPKGHAQDILFSNADVKAKGITVGAETCIDTGED